MSYGFLSNTDNGYAQIDGENLQLKVLASGSVVPGVIGSSSSGTQTKPRFLLPFHQATAQRMSFFLPNPQILANLQK